MAEVSCALLNQYTPIKINGNNLSLKPKAGQQNDFKDVLLNQHNLQNNLRKKILLPKIFLKCEK